MNPQKPILLLSLFLAITPLAAGQTQNPVLVELFTSQGCSSCPPAEDWLNRTGLELFQKGQIIPLAFHVHYWDYLGWKDPFSQKAFTDRQNQYAHTLADSSLYTPEMVVAGRIAMVGSDGARALSAIQETQARPQDVHFSFTATRAAGGIRVKVAPLSRGSLKPSWKVMAALFENGRETRVERGENTGRTLKENFVVRQLTELKLGPQGAVIPLPPGTQASQTGLAVFIQDPGTMEVLAARCKYPL